MTIRKKVTVVFLEKMFFAQGGIFEPSLEFFGHFETKLGPKKNEQKKGYRYVFSYGHEQHPCQISFSNSS